MSVRGEERSRKRYAVRDDESEQPNRARLFDERRSDGVSVRGEERSRKRYAVRDDEGVIRTDSTEKKKRTVRRKHGVPVNSEDCLSEASDIMCRATYRAIKLACDSGGEDGNEQTGAKSLKEYWSVLKEALSVTGSINDGSDGGSVLHVVMDECADRYAE